MTSSRCVISWMCVASVLAWAGPTAAEPTTYGVGLFGPELGLTPYQTYDEVDRIARHLSKEVGVKMVGRGYKVRKDFMADLRGKKIHFALIGGFELATIKGVRRLLAVASAKGGSKWTLMAAENGTWPGVAGKVLQLPNAGPSVVGFVEYGLLAGNLSVRKHFKVVRSPGLFSAVEAVRLGAAAAVFAPVGTAGLVALLPVTLAVPRPGFVLVSRDVPAAVIQQVTRALAGFRGKGVAAGGFVPGKLSMYRAFAAKRKRRRLALVPSKPENLELSGRGLFGPYPVTFESPEAQLSAQFVMP